MANQKQVLSALREIIDPHTNLNIYDMGLISNIRASKTSVSLTFRPTSPFCPLGAQLALNIKRRMLEIKGVKKATVKVIGHVWEEDIDKFLKEV